MNSRNRGWCSCRPYLVSASTVAVPVYDVIRYRQPGILVFISGLSSVSIGRPRDIVWRNSRGVHRRYCRLVYTNTTVLWYTVTGQRRRGIHSRRIFALSKRNRCPEERVIEADVVRRRGLGSICLLYTAPGRSHVKSRDVWRHIE